MQLHSQPPRLARALLLAGLVVLALAVVAPAAAAPACAMKVIDDWYDNGRVDGTYPVHCYDDAIDALPRDVRDYSSAKEDIQRALQARLNRQPAPPARTDPSPDPEQTGTDETPTTETDTTGGGGTTTDRAPDDPDGATEASGGAVNTSASDSVPLPLLVLAGLALLLVAAGSAGYLVRRLQARRLPPAA